MRERWPDERVFTYWDYRAGMFHQDLGMRIDLVLAGAPVAERVRAAWVDRHARKGSGPSDHAPVIVDLDEAPDGDIGPVVPPPSAPVTRRGAKKLPQAPSPSLALGVAWRRVHLNQVITRMASGLRVHDHARPFVLDRQAAGRAAPGPTSSPSVPCRAPAASRSTRRVHAAHREGQKQVEGQHEGRPLGNTDDGAGFDPSVARRGAGLANLTHRVAAVGGTLHIEARPGRGTRISGSLPS